MLDFFRLSKGIELDRTLRILAGTGSPGVSGDTSTAQVGSFYLDSAGDAFVKQLAGSGTNKWQTIATEAFVTALISTISWREPVEVADTTSPFLPTGTPGNPIVVAGETITDKQRVLFVAIVGGGGPNIYIYDQPTGTFTEDTNLQTQGDNVFVKRGTYANRRFVYTGIVWNTYDAIFKNTVFVQKDPGIDQYGTIKDALDYAATQSPSTLNPWSVVIYPGVYTENAMTIVSGVYVTSVGVNSVNVVAANATDDIFTLQSNTGLRGVVITGASSGRAIVVIDAEDVDIDELTLANNQTDIYIEGNSASTSVAVHDLTYVGTSIQQYPFRVISTGGQTVKVSLNVAIMNLESSSSLVNALEVTGTGALVVFHSTTVTNDDSGVGLYVADGATVSSTGLTIGDVGLGLHIPNIGAPPTLYIQLQIVQNDAPNVLVEHTGTLGFIAGALDHDEVTIAPGTTKLSLAYNGTDATDPGDVGFSVIGSLLLGSEQGNTTDVTDLIQQASPTGTLSGGIITTTINPLEVSVSGGYGYLVDSVTIREKRVVWSTTLLTLPNNAESYIYVDNAGAVTFAASPPDVVETILLGRVRTSGGNVVLVAVIPLIATQSATFLDQYLRNAIGSIFGTGSIVAEDITPLQLDVTSGTYYYSKQTFHPSGGSPIANFTRYFHTGGIPDSNISSTVDNTQYDNGTNLTPLTAGFYTKHTIYLAGDGANEGYSFVYGQAEYATLVDAQTAPLPTPPSFLTLDINVPLAAMIVQEGAPNIVQIIDIRPRLGFQAPSTAGVTVHGDLSGLLADDHPQYLLVSGTRAMSGNLNMGGNSITNVNLVDGVDVPAHGGRHGATSADPIPTAAPITNLTPSSTNALGSANTLARSDHSHAITGFQLQDADLDALAALTTTGLIIRTGSGTATTRSLVQPAAGITISNNDGVAGNPTFALANDLAALEGLAGTGIAVRSAADTWVQRTIQGTTNRISLVNGSGVGGDPTIDISVNYAGQSTITIVGTITSGTWNGALIATGFGGTGLNTYAQGDILYANAVNTLTTLAKNVTASRYLSNSGTSNNPAWAQVDLTNGVTGILPIGNGGTGTANGALADPGGNGVVVRTALNTTTNRTITGTVNRISVSNGTGVAGNPTIDIDAAYIGQASITTLGTVTTGVWNGTTIDIAHGGTGQTTAITAFNALSPLTTQGDLLYFDGSNNVRLAKNTTATRYLANTGTTNNPQWDQINLTNGVTGALPIGNGGTGQTTQTSAFDALSPATTKGDLIVFNGTDNVRQAVGTNNQALVSDSTQANGVRWASNGGLLLYAENPSTPTAPSAAGTNAVAIGNGSSASATNSMALGQGTAARIQGMQAFANGDFATAGDAQKGEYILRNSTTTATLTELFIDGSAIRLALPNNSAFNFLVQVVARRTDATGGRAAYAFQGLIYRDANAASTAIQGGVTKTVLAESNAAWDVTVDADTTNGSLRVQVTGEAGKTIRWVAYVRTIEVTN